VLVGQGSPTAAAMVSLRSTDLSSSITKVPHNGSNAVAATIPRALDPRRTGGITRCHDRLKFLTWNLMVMAKCLPSSC
jgi:hypothetical protein